MKRWKAAVGAFMVLALMTAPVGRALASAGVGEPAPDFTRSNIGTGPTQFSLSDYDGSVVVIVFFAYW